MPLLPRAMLRPKECASWLPKINYGQGCWVFNKTERERIRPRPFLATFNGNVHTDHTGIREKLANLHDPKLGISVRRTEPPGNHGIEAKRTAVGRDYMASM